MDNAPVHPKHLIGRHRNVRVEFLPPNTTSLLQPLDQEVICNFKLFYQRRSYQQLASSTNTMEEIQLMEAEEVERGSSDDSDKDDDELPPLTPSASTSSATASTSNPASPPAHTSTPRPEPEVVSAEIVTVTKFWKLYNIKHAINNAIAAWNEVSAATINHSW
ncbi:MAG: hypothetical protein KAG66_10215, partial [Methylococcales bacterium]|nr:hypothetical protein [Methylococcales bacterium]